MQWFALLHACYWKRAHLNESANLFDFSLKHCVQVTLVDGNGILHCNGFGSASHVGVCCDIPTIGVAKSLLHIPEKGIGKDTAKVILFGKF